MESDSFDQETWASETVARLFWSLINIFLDFTHYDPWPELLYSLQEIIFPSAHRILIILSPPPPPAHFDGISLMWYTGMRYPNGDQ